MRNIRHGSPLASCIVPNRRHGCLGLYNRCRFIHTNLYLKVLQFDILILLYGTAHFLGNVSGLIKEVFQINVPCLLIEHGSKWQVLKNEVETSLKIKKK